jgi:hypothetical protein
MLGWSAPKLAQEAGVSESCVRDFEKGRHRIIGENRDAIQFALQRGGIEFMDEDGLRYRQPLNGHAVPSPPLAARHGRK